MTPAKIFPLALALASAALPAAAAQRATPAATANRASIAATSIDFSASRHRVHRVRHATRVDIYRHGDYSFFEPYAPPVPLFFPFGYRRGYF
jgi:hypothetical protein